MMHHPNIVLMMSSCTGPLTQDMFLILEPLDASGSLHNILHHNQKKYTTFESICIITDILEGRLKHNSSNYDCTKSASSLLAQNSHSDKYVMRIG